MSTKQTSGRGLVAQDISDLLREEILNGTHAPGGRLGEVALAERFDVSRGPIRAALNLLADAGVVTLAPNSGAKVRILHRADALALYQVRTALESEAAALAARNVTAETGHELCALLDKHANEIAAHPSGAYMQGQVDSDFHIIVARMAANPIILQFLTKEFYPQLSLLRVKHKHVTGRGLKALREHQRIADAIKEGDAEIASLLMRRHINNSWTALEAQIQDEEAAK